MNIIDKITRADINRIPDIRKPLADHVFKITKINIPELNKTCIKNRATDFSNFDANFIKGIKKDKLHKILSVSLLAIQVAAIATIALSTTLLASTLLVPALPVALIFLSMICMGVTIVMNRAHPTYLPPVLQEIAYIIEAFSHTSVPDRNAITRHSEQIRNTFNLIKKHAKEITDSITKEMVDLAKSSSHDSNRMMELAEAKKAVELVVKLYTQAT